jgi:hypothetical protein
MNLVSLLVLPAIISLEDDNIRFVIAAVSTVVLLGSIVFSKRDSGGIAAEDVVTASA